MPSDPSGYVECSWGGEGEALTNDAIGRLRDALPQLVAALRVAISRGAPPAQ